MTGKKGFTVVEMLVGLLIMGIMAALALSIGRSSVQRASFTTGVNQFVADMAFIKQLASSESRYVAIDFNNSGRSYTILKQRTIGDLVNFQNVRQVIPMDGKQLFEGKKVQDFAVSSTGEVFAYPLAAGSDPIQITMSFFIRKGGSSNVDYQRTVRIFPTGGIKVEK